ncbi:hypothetical protein MtrunA17_Chr5g0400251 [Medicago truncatula]|uniref:Uncharacterized protein n=1 Tax=Medicago truncatula TaxID=3880 RepID=A0A396HN28_MEDTR|nr:hypothetical protein MtrunA17_Chr5g0400251 [Medicago truncatula]
MSDRPIMRKIRKSYINIVDEKGLNWRKKPCMGKRNRKSNKIHKNILEILGLLGVGEKCLNFKVKMHPLIYII